MPETLTIAKKERLAFFDNARFWLILLVIIGHWTAYARTEHNPGLSVYVFIYLFHMPAFIYITGYLTRRFTLTQDSARKTLVTLVWPVLVFELVSQGILRSVENDSYAINPFATQWLGWFLWAMVVWRVLTPFMLSLRWPLAWAIGVSLLAPLLEWPNIFALDKVLGFLPFYVAGLITPPTFFAELRKTSIRIASACFLGAVFIGCFFLGNFNTTVLLWKRSYNDPLLGTTALEGLLLRGLLLLVGILMTLAFLALVPHPERWCSGLGKRTLYAYLLHGFFILGAVYCLGWRPDTIGSWLLGIIVFTGVGLVLLSPLVEKIFKPLLQPSLGFLFAKSDRYAKP